MAKFFSVPFAVWLNSGSIEGRFTPGFPHMNTDFLFFQRDSSLGAITLQSVRVVLFSFGAVQVSKNVLRNFSNDHSSIIGSSLPSVPLR